MNRYTAWLLAVTCIGIGVSSGADGATPLRYNTRLQAAAMPGAAAVEVFVHAHVLDASDRLRDGPYGRDIHLDGKTLLCEPASN